MAMATVLTVSFVVAFLRGGRLNQEIRGLIFPIIAVLVQLPITLLYPGTTAGMVANIAGYVIALPFWWLNRRSVGMSVLLVGLVLNLTVIAVNGGRMPSDYALAGSMGIVLPAGELPKHQAISASTRLSFLGDVIPIRPLHRVSSPGDLLLMVGVFLFVQEIMGRPFLQWLVRKT